MIITNIEFIKLFLCVLFRFHRQIVILKQLLLQLKLYRDIDAMEAAIEAGLSKEDVAYVEEQVAALLAKKDK